MPGIKFNRLTKEISIKGPESFIDSNFNKIQDLLVASFGVKRKMTVSKKTKTYQESPPLVKMKKSHAGAEIRRNARSEASRISSAIESFIPAEISYELKAKRPPLRKYIRKEGMPGHERIVVQVAEQKPGEISIASLKEKFGLSESKIDGVIRDAEKLGKIRRVMNGSYVWTQD
jgi:uncharacterized membrane protein